MAKMAAFIFNPSNLIQKFGRFGQCRFLKITGFFFAFSACYSMNAYAQNNVNSPSKSQFKKRNYISVVGSSTVYPFTAVIAEKFGKRYKKYRTPTVEANGTGGGFKLFCSGVGYKFADFSNASRKIEESEIALCRKNGVYEIGEIKIGYDGIVLANSTLGQKINLTKKQLFLALAQKVPQNGKLVDNFYKKWSQIDANLPNFEIRIYGPPPSSGTRDAFVELVMEEFCVENSVFISEFADKKIRAKKCHTIRSDGHFIEAGENDNLILQKLKNDKQAFGVFGFSFLSENKNTMQAAKINYVDPNFETIESGQYSVSRPLFIYFKKEHFALVDGTKEFVQAILSLDTLGQDGYLAQKGLISLSDLELKRMRDKILQDL